MFTNGVYGDPKSWPILWWESALRSTLIRLEKEFSRLPSPLSSLSLSFLLPLSLWEHLVLSLRSSSRAFSPSYTVSFPSSFLSMLLRRIIGSAAPPVSRNPCVLLMVGRCAQTIRPIGSCRGLHASATRNSLCIFGTLVFNGRSSTACSFALNIGI